MCGSDSDDIFIIALSQVRTTVQRLAEGTIFSTPWLVVNVLVAINTLMRGTKEHFDSQFLPSASKSSVHVPEPEAIQL